MAQLMDTAIRHGFDADEGTELMVCFCVLCLEASDEGGEWQGKAVG
jgi:hypothetical protein